MTQLGFFNFELQAFLFLVFHRRLLAVLGHFVFMLTANLCLLAALSEVHIGAINAAVLYAVILAVWYGTVALAARLPGWLAVMLPMVGLLYVGSASLAGFFRGRMHVAPVWGYVASAFLVAMSHAAEPDLPPRTVDPWRWISLRTYLLGPGPRASERLARLAHILSIIAMGTVAESWASLRLMPYNWLLRMMRLGYAPDRYAELADWSERAWASGNPALDFVGTGGGTFLAAGEDVAARPRGVP
jgi:hypothetical protein